MATTSLKAVPTRLADRHVREVPKEPEKAEKKNSTVTLQRTNHEKSALGKMMNKDLDEQFNIFMKMFITQLQNQDPTEPLDGTQMTNNLLMFFSAAEQAKTNFHLEKLNESHENEQLIAAKSYLNKEVVYEGQELTFDGQPQTISVDVPKGAKNPTLMIFDPQTNQRIKTFQLQEKLGTQTISWAGDLDGGKGPVPQGQYVVRVQAEKDKNTWYDITPRMKGVVTAIDYNDNKEYIYYVNNTPVRFENIQQVRKPMKDVSLNELKDSLQQQINSIDNLKSLVEKRVIEDVPRGGIEEIPLVHEETSPAPLNPSLAPPSPEVKQDPSLEKGALDTVVDAITGLFK